MESLLRSRTWREPRRWLAPFSPIYAAAAALHRAWMLAGAPSGRPRTPLVVIGSLRAGGSGKTPVAEAMARHYAGQGLRVALLAYRLGPGRTNPSDPDLQEVFPDSAWRHFSDEAVLLASALDPIGVRVFAVRDRARAWRSLDGDFDLVLSDDGFQDPRLRGAFRILLRRPGEDPGLFDLLPAGPFRRTRRAAAGADLVLRGPLPWDGPDPAAPKVNLDVTGSLQDTLPFRARALLPEGASPDRPCAVLCALGDNRRFLADLAAAGLRVREALEAPDHAGFPGPGLEAFARRHADAALLCTRKDFLKLPPGAAERFGILVAEREIALPAGLWEAVDRYRDRFGVARRADSGGTLPPPLPRLPNLVH